MLSTRSRLEQGAARAFYLKDYRRAAKRLTELLEHVGENPHTLQTLALCHERMGEDSRALEFAHRALSSAPDHLPTLQLLARVHFIREEHEDARRFVEQGLRAVARLEQAAARSRPTSGWLVRTVSTLSGLGRGPLSKHDREWVEWANAYLQTEIGQEETSS